MPADPSIYDDLRYPGHGMPTYQEQQAQRLSRQADEQVLKERQQTLQERQAKLRAEQEAAQRKQADEARVAALMQKHFGERGMDYKALMADAYQNAPDLAPAIETRALDIRDKTVKTEIQELEAEAKRVKFLSERVQGVQDQDDLDLLMPSLRAYQEKYGDPIADMIGPVYDPKKVELVVSSGMEHSNYLQRKSAIAKSKDDDLTKALKMAAIVDADPQEWADVFGYARLHGVEDELKSLGLSEEFAPNGPSRASQLLLSPEKLGELKNPKPQTASEGSDYGRFEADYLATEAEKKGRPLSHPETVNAKLAARRAYGQADDAQQRPWAPVVIQTPTGYMQVDRGAGTAAPVTTAGGDQVKRPLPAAAVTTVATGDLSLSMIDDIERALPKMLGFIGPYDGRKADVSLKTGIGATQQLADFDAQLTALKNATIKAITGAQMSEPEAKRIMGQLPDKTQPEAVFKARLAATRRNIETLNAAIQRLSGSGGASSGLPRLRFNPATGKVETVK